MPCALTYGVCSRGQSSPGDRSTPQWRGDTEHCCHSCTATGSPVHSVHRGRLQTDTGCDFTQITAWPQIHLPKQTATAHPPKQASAESRSQNSNTEISVIPTLGVWGWVLECGNSLSGFWVLLRIKLFPQRRKTFLKSHFMTNRN